MAPEDPTSPPDVMSSLPRTRPQRRSAKRGAPVKASAAPANGAAASKKPAAAKKPAAKHAAPKKAAAKRPAARKAPAKAAAGPRIPPAGFAPPPGDVGRTPSGTELVGTAIQAAGELAQIGMAVGGQALRSALGRLGRS